MEKTAKILEEIDKAILAYIENKKKALIEAIDRIAYTIIKGIFNLVYKARKENGR